MINDAVQLSGVGRERNAGESARSPLIRRTICGITVGANTAPNRTSKSYAGSRSSASSPFSYRRRTSSTIAVRVDALMLTVPGQSACSWEQLIVTGGSTNSE